MSSITNQVRKRPRLGLSFGLAVLILALVTVVPFKFERIIGYEVAIAGVDKGLALDSERVDFLLETIGVGEANFHIEGCEEKCRIKITDLKTASDVKIVEAAFGEMGHCSIEEIKEISARESNSLIGQARHKIFIRPSIVLKDDEDISRTVIEKINSLKCDSVNFNIWVIADSTASSMAMDMKHYEGHMDSKEGEFVWMWIQQDPSERHVTMIIDESADASSYAEITTPDGKVHIINLDDDYAAEELRKLGYDCNLKPIDKNTDNRIVLHEIAMTRDKNIDDKNESESDSRRKIVKETSSNLPEGYKLSQNYPNPFNPNTWVDYAVPAAQHVEINIFNMKGQKVRTLVNSVVESGQHTVQWDATNDEGDPVATGMYLCEFKAGDVTDTKKMLFIK